MPVTPEIEPMLPSDKAIEKSSLRAKARALDIKAAELGGQLAPVTARVITQTLRVINSYYSNLIEGNDTKPADIRKAMRGEYSSDITARNHQIESVAHTEVQSTLANESVDSSDLSSVEFMCRVHKLFFERLPKELYVLEDGSLIVPGEIRQRNVEVGRHLPPNHEDLTRLLSRFKEAYSPSWLRNDPLIGIMAAHHRFAFIHPFADGNGRVARLLTDEMLRAYGVGGAGVWCLSRGLARSARDPKQSYKSMLGAADASRKGNGDGKGALTESGLVEFIGFMLDTALDQVSYMHSLIAPAGVRERIDAYVAERNNGMIIGLNKIKPEAARILKVAFTEGEVKRGSIPEITGMNKNTARKLVQQMKEDGLLTETSTKSPLHIGIPDHIERYLLPGLGD